MKKIEQLEKIAEQKQAARQKKYNKPKMSVTGKSVFKLKELISRPNDRIPKRYHPKKDR